LIDGNGEHVSIKTTAKTEFCGPLEAMSLKRSGTQPVAMSACDTAQGVTDAYEGIYGPSRGFQIAGADNVLVRPREKVRP
jgi:CHAT domain-containing protein